MSYALLELALVTLAVSGAAGYALWRWWPRRPSSGCASGCASCATGCSSGDRPAAKPPPDEQPIRFHR